MKKIVTKAKRRKVKPRVGVAFFNSNTAKLFFIIIIAMVIPLTVLSVQRVQNLQQEAAGTSIPDSQKCDGESNEFGAIADPQPVKEDAEITFRLKDETDMVDVEKNNFGNGVVSSSCKQNGNAVTCTAKGNFKNDAKSSTHTWVYLSGSGEKQLCKYTVEDNLGQPRPTKKPTPTKDPAATPKTANCTGKMETACTVDNKPRLLISYDLSGGTDGSCDVSIDDASQSDKRISINTKCVKKTQFAMDSLDGAPLKNNSNYRLVVKNGNSCKEYIAVGQVTTNCGGGQKPPTPTSTQGGGNPTATPAPKFGTPENVTAKCEGNQDEPKITVSWKQVASAVSYTAKLANAQGGSAVKEGGTDKTTFTFDGIEKGKTYWYTVSAKDGSGKSSQPSANTRNIKCTNDNLPPAGVISAVAQTFQDMLNTLMQ